jgi:hypothetical protein
MSLVHNLQTLEGVGLVFLTEHCTVRAYGSATGVTVVIQGCIIVLDTYFFLLFDLFGLKGVYCCCDFFNEAAIY